MQRGCNLRAPILQRSDAHHFRDFVPNTEGVMMTVYAQPGAEGSIVSYRSRYENYIGGDWTAPSISTSRTPHR